jgi:hypothetical protein
VKWLGAAFLAAQVVIVAAGHLTGGRSFAWAPHTTQVSYTLDVTVDGRRLSTSEIRDRLGLIN